MPTTQHVFNATAATYDRDRARLIPGFDRFYEVAVSLIPAGTATVLDLGAGTGLLAAFIRARFPAARIHLMDVSEPMLANAREHLSDYANITFETTDYTSAPFASYDAVVSALSIHHLEDLAKKNLFSKIHAALRPGGVFINADQVLGPTPSLEARYKQLWLNHVRDLGATEQQIQDSLYRQQQDGCASVDDQLQWLRGAGFADADCWFKDHRFAVMAASRSVQ